MSFYTEIQNYNWEEVKKQIYSKTEADVLQALSTTNPDLNGFQALISPAAEKHIESMAQKSMAVTRKRFGNTIQVYTPLYLSNYCTNTCVYCGFNHSNEMDRKKLNRDEMLQEAKMIKDMGIEHILLVTGEDHKECGTAYIKEMVEIAREIFSLVSIEVQPLDKDEYRFLAEYGLNTVYIYQETYHEKNYKLYHPSGKKSKFQYRLETPDRLGMAGVHKIGLGCLLGLEDWRVDSFYTALHLNYLEKKYWKTKYSISFPRLRPHIGSFDPNFICSQKDLLQLICAYRIFNEQIELSLSTRESQAYRNHMLKLGVTAYSAGSRTNPGAYASEEESLEQFSVNDERSPEEIAKMIKGQGYEIVWKDWDSYMQ